MRFVPPPRPARFCLAPQRASTCLYSALNAHRFLSVACTIRRRRLALRWSAKRSSCSSSRRYLKTFRLPHGIRANLMELCKIGGLHTYLKRSALIFCPQLSNLPMFFCLSSIRLPLLAHTGSRMPTFNCSKIISAS